MARRFLASGASVTLWDRDEAALAAAREALGNCAADEVVPLTDSKAVADAAKRVHDRAGQIDILVNNAGITGGNAPAWDLDPAAWREVLEVNLTAPFLTARAVVPFMLPRRHGRIINMASIAGKEGNPNASHYSASKAGLIGFTKALAKELADSGILVNAITPAVAKTDLFQQMTPEHIEYMRSRIPMGRFCEVEEIAALTAWIASGDCSFTTGAVFDISGGRATY